ncbi:MAG: PKD domain-containing protein [Bacteroidetes bacterium]|nr:MAG: PKD domain-containing protein [Bacteroidota bacterium]
MALTFKMKSRILVVLSLLVVALSVQAAHIIGGVISYECLGQGEYKFTMKIYRDCNGGGAPFDSALGSQIPGTVTVYQGNNNVPYTIVQLAPPVITSIQPNLSNPCLIAPNVCVEEGVYEFFLDLPVSPQSYHIVYQRCCRNNTITNILSPGETGATYWMELTAEAQANCNNSPVFKDFPPIVICSGEPINFDHSAIDEEGDMLVYELCTPFDGGGTNQTDPFEPQGVAPNPDLPPPFSPVTFLAPNYTWNSPLAADPPLQINAVTGLLTGEPNALGQYVVGVCVKEYRDNKLLSVTRRDFQFNVAQCDPTVVADILEDSLVTAQGEQQFVVRGCGNTVTFKNQSFQAQYINNYRWEFDINGTTETKTTWDANVTFPGPGTYFGKLFLNPGTGCGDTANIKVHVYPEINADFSFDYDTCLAGPVSFFDQSTTGDPGGIDAWSWDFGDGIISISQNPQHIYTVPGNIPVTLLVTDQNDCTDALQKTIPYFPVPQLLVVAPSEYVGCQPASIFFENLSTPINDQYTVNWDFGDGTTGQGISPTHIYEDIGVFDVSLEIISPIGCQTDTFWPELITVLPSPIADFTYTPNQPSNIEPTVYFTDQSIDAVKWRWMFGNVGNSIQQNPSFTFPDTGMQVVQLVVFHESGCTDTMIQMLDVIPEVRYWLPNAFTPDGDGNNDVFKGKGLLEGATNFRMMIFNRYGERIFETTDPDEGWNGRKNNVGEMAPLGVYPVVVTFTDPRGKPVEFRGFATLVK